MKKQCFAFFALLIGLLNLASATVDPTDQRCAIAARGVTIDYNSLEVCLSNQGVLMEVHGAVPMSSMFVVSFRNPTNFFQSVHLSLLGANAQTREFVKTLRRHDVILVKGRFENVETPQRHIRAQSMQLISRSAGSTPSEEYSYQAIPAVFQTMDKFIGKVHAIYAEGRVLVVEYKDLVVPVMVDRQFLHLTKDLFRGDKIEIQYVIQEEPIRPIHLNLNPKIKEPLKVLNSVVENHGRYEIMTGKLVMFPKSPMVMFDVYAIDVDMGDGVMLPHTVLSFTDPDLFAALRKEFERVWNKHPLMVRNYRNKFVNEAITVTVEGFYNMIDPLQANPQLIIEKIQDVTIHGEEE